MIDRQSSRETREDVEPTAEELEAGRAFARVLACMRRLRAPDGCPWDRDQTLGSLRRN